MPRINKKFPGRIILPGNSLQLSKVFIVIYCQANKQQEHAVNQSGN